MTTRHNALVTIETTLGIPPLRLSLMLDRRAPYRRGSMLKLTLVASGGAGGYVYSIASGSLPAGMSALDTTTGTSTGTLTTVGRYEFVAQVQDAASTIAQHRFAIEIVGTLVPADVTPIDGCGLEAYEYQMRVTGNVGAVTWSKISGDLPAGLTLAGDGTISGTNIHHDDDTLYYSTLRATDGSTGDTLDCEVRMRVFATMLAIAPDFEFLVYVGATYTDVGLRDSGVFGGALPYSWKWDTSDYPWLTGRIVDGGVLFSGTVPTFPDAEIGVEHSFPGVVTDALGHSMDVEWRFTPYMRALPKEKKADAPSDGKHYARKDGAWDALGTAAGRDVPTSGDASATQVVLGNDSRLGGGGGSSLLMLDMFSGIDSTIYGSGQKRVVGQRSIDPSAAIYGLGPSSTATLCVLLATTYASSAACAELFQMTGTGSPQIIAATTTTTSLSSALVSADVSAAFTDTSPSGIFAVRVWTASPDGTKQAVCYGAWLEIEP